MSLSTLVGKMFGSGDSEATVSPSQSSAKNYRSLQRLQYCGTLNRENEVPTPTAVAKAWKFLEQDMAVVPTGPTRLLDSIVYDQSALDGSESHASQIVDVDTFYIDKTAVTNADYAQFVRAGGYEKTEFWAQETWSRLMQFVDKSGTLGPKYWQNGRPLRDRLDHPVVGICWFEADAYARWAGKKLPDTAQWQRAASWHTTKTEEANPPKFPWGDTFESQFANAWVSGIGSTVSVENYYKGATPNGVFQLIGNTWEMTSNQFVIQNSNTKNSNLVEIRGGAFDTYLDCQMTCQFRSGLPMLFRGSNVGFRCVASVSDLHRPQ